jgi:hypothetical protein
MKEMMAARLSSDVRGWVEDFLRRCGAPQSKLLNESLRIAKPILEARLSGHQVLFTSPIDDAECYPDVSKRLPIRDRRAES